MATEQQDFFRRLQAAVDRLLTGGSPLPAREPSREWTAASPI
jgi:hypothetical protein